MVKTTTELFSYYSTPDLETELNSKEVKTLSEKIKNCLLGYFFKNEDFYIGYENEEYQENFDDFAEEIKRNFVIRTGFPLSGALLVIEKKDISRKIAIEKLLPPRPRIDDFSERDLIYERLTGSEQNYKKFLLALNLACAGFLDFCENATQQTTASPISSSSKVENSQREQLAEDLVDIYLKNQKTKEEAEFLLQNILDDLTINATWINQKAAEIRPKDLETQREKRAEKVSKPNKKTHQAISDFSEYEELSASHRSDFITTSRTQHQTICEMKGGDNEKSFFDQLQQRFSGFFTEPQSIFKEFSRTITCAPCCSDSELKGNEYLLRQIPRETRTSEGLHNNTQVHYRTQTFSSQRPDISSSGRITAPRPNIYQDSQSRDVGQYSTRERDSIYFSDFHDELPFDTDTHHLPGHEPKTGYPSLQALSYASLPGHDPKTDYSQYGADQFYQQDALSPMEVESNLASSEKNSSHIATETKNNTDKSFGLAKEVDPDLHLKVQELRKSANSSRNAPGSTPKLTKPVKAPGLLGNTINKY